MNRPIFNAIPHTLKAKALFLGLFLVCATFCGRTAFAGAIYTMSSTVVQQANNPASLTNVVEQEIKTSYTLLSPTQLQITTSFTLAPTPVDGVIAGVYLFDALNVLGDIATIQTSNPDQFRYEPLATPGSLPGASQYDDVTYQAAKKGWSGTGLKGGNPGNTLTVTIALNNPMTDATLYSALVNTQLAIGYHVQSINGSGGLSDSFVQNVASLVISNNTPIPEPTTVTLFVFGLIGLVGLRRLRQTP